jgi:serine protease Do
MKAFLPRAAALLFAFAALCAACRAAAPPAPRAAAAAARRKTPVVVAVEKAHKGVVVLKVSRPGSSRGKPVVGTGVVVDERGYIVTAHHVIAGADHISVHLHDKTVLRAAVHAQEPRSDLAILRVRPAGPLTALPYGPGGDLMAGETVIAIGHPYGYTGTVSTGIISALGREITMPSGETLSNLTQTSAAVNPGNSGGPLLNINGEWIGLVVALRENAQNIGFALNIDTVKRVVSRHVRADKVVGTPHPALVVKEQVVVEHASDGGPSGLREGDVLLRVADRAVHSRADVERALSELRPGESVEATVLRDGRTARVGITLDGAEATTIRLPRPRR